MKYDNANLNNKINMKNISLDKIQKELSAANILILNYKMNSIN